MFISEYGLLGSTTSYGTEQPPKGTLKVPGIVIVIGVFFIKTVYLVSEVYAADMDAYVFMISKAYTVGISV